MDALRTKIDGLQWEVSRLDAENRKLRDGDVEASKRVDLEAELDQLKRDYAELTTELETCKQRLHENTGALASAERRATEAESGVERLECEVGILKKAHYEELALATTRATDAEEQISQLHSKMDGSQQEVSVARENLVLMEREVEGWKAKLDAQREAMNQEAELSRYRCLEEEKRKWEAREERLVVQLESVRHELADLKASKEEHVDTHTAVIAIEEKLLSTRKALECSDQKISDLIGSNEVKQLEINELRAEIGLL